MKLKTQEKRTELLHLKNLMLKHEGGEIRVYLAPDRTLKQQQEHKKLVAELKERRSRGEEGLVIRNSKIVSFHPILKW